MGHPREDPVHIRSRISEMLAHLGCVVVDALFIVGWGALQFYVHHFFESFQLKGIEVAVRLC